MGAQNSKGKPKRQTHEHDSAKEELTKSLSYNSNDEGSSVDNESASLQQEVTQTLTPLPEENPEAEEEPTVMSGLPGEIAPVNFTLNLEITKEAETKDVSQNEIQRGSSEKSGTYQKADNVIDIIEVSSNIVEHEKDSEDRWLPSLQASIHSKQFCREISATRRGYCVENAGTIMGEGKDTSHSNGLHVCSEDRVPARVNDTKDGRKWYSGQDFGIKVQYIKIAQENWSKPMHFDSGGLYKKKVTKDEEDNRCIPPLEDSNNDVIHKQIFMNVIFLPDKSKGASPKRYGPKRLGSIYDSITEDKEKINSSIDDSETSSLDGKKECEVSLDSIRDCETCTLNKENAVKELTESSIVKHRTEIPKTESDTNKAIVQEQSNQHEELSCVDDHFGLYSGLLAEGVSKDFQAQTQSASQCASIELKQSVLFEDSITGKIIIDDKSLQTDSHEIPRGNYKGNTFMQRQVQVAHNKSDNVEIGSRTSLQSLKSDEKIDAEKDDQNTYEQIKGEDVVEICKKCKEPGDLCLCLFPDIKTVMFVTNSDQKRPGLSYLRYLRIGDKEIHWPNLKSLQAVFLKGLRACKTKLSEDNRVTLKFSLPIYKGNFEPKQRQQEVENDHDDARSSGETLINNIEQMFRINLTDKPFSGSIDSHRNIMINDFDECSDDDNEAVDDDDDLSESGDNGEKVHFSYLDTSQKRTFCICCGTLKKYENKDRIFNQGIASNDNVINDLNKDEKLIEENSFCEKCTEQGICNGDVGLSKDRSSNSFPGIYCEKENSDDENDIRLCGYEEQKGFENDQTCLDEGGDKMIKLTISKEREATKNRSDWIKKDEKETHMSTVSVNTFNVDEEHSEKISIISENNRQTPCDICSDKDSKSRFQNMQLLEECVDENQNLEAYSVTTAVRTDTGVRSISVDSTGSPTDDIKLLKNEELGDCNNGTLISKELKESSDDTHLRYLFKDESYIGRKKYVHLGECVINDRKNERETISHISSVANDVGNKFPESLHFERNTSYSSLRKTNGFDVHENDESYRETNSKGNIFTLDSLSSNDERNSETDIGKSIYVHRHDDYDQNRAENPDFKSRHVLSEDNQSIPYIDVTNDIRNEDYKARMARVFKRKKTKFEVDNRLVAISSDEDEADGGNVNVKAKVSAPVEQTSKRIDNEVPHEITSWSERPLDHRGKCESPGQAPESLMKNPLSSKHEFSLPQKRLQAKPAEFSGILERLTLDNDLDFTLPPDDFQKQLFERQAGFREFLDKMNQSNHRFHLSRNPQRPEGAKSDFAASFYESCDQKVDFSKLGTETPENPTADYDRKINGPSREGERVMQPGTIDTVERLMEERSLFSSILSPDSSVSSVPSSRSQSPVPSIDTDDNDEEVSKRVDIWSHLVDQEKTACLKNMKIQKNVRCTVLCVDVSSSMQGSPWKQVKAFILEFLSGLEERKQRDNIHEYVGMVTFGCQTKILSQPTENFEQLIKLLHSISQSGQSPLLPGLALSLIFQTVRRELGHTYCQLHDIIVSHRIILLSDGRPSPCSQDGLPDNFLDDIQQEEAVQEVETSLQEWKLPQEHVHIDCVPFGENPNIDFLERICKASDGRLVLPADVQVLVNSTHNHYKSAQVAKQMFQMKTDTLDIRMYKSIIQALYPDVTERDLAEMVELAEAAHARVLAQRQDGVTNITTSDEVDVHFEPANMEVLPSIGTRICLGPDASEKYYTFTPGKGTVTGHSRKHRGKVFVQWDCGSNTLCNYGYNDKFEVIPDDSIEPCKIDDHIKIGHKVRRGPDWQYGNQDGGGDQLGTVYHIQTDGTVRVKWSNGNYGNYRYNQNGVFDVILSDPSDPFGINMFESAMNKRNDEKSKTTLHHEDSQRHTDSARDSTLPAVS